MDKAGEMGKTSAVGSLQLFLGTSVSTVITAIATIVLGWFISPNDYGLYTIAIIPATTLALFQDWGIGTALTRYCAKYKGTNDQFEQKKVIIAGLTFEFISGLVLTIVSFFIADFLAFTVFGKPASGFLITIVSVTLLSGAMASGINSIFVGFEQMKPTQYGSVVRAVTYSILVPLLVLLGYGAVGAVIGFALASVSQAIFSLFMFHFLLFKKLPHTKTTRFDIIQTLKQLLGYSTPLAVANIVGGISGPIYAFLMAHYISEALIGNYKIATNFAVLLTFLNIPIATVLFPAFSKVDPKNEKSLLKTVFSSSVKYTSLLLIPATLALVVFSQPLIGTLYGAKWPSAPLFLSLYLLNNLLALFGSKSMGALLPALGETKFIMKINLLSLLIAIPLAFLLVPPLGMVGLIVGGQVSGVPSNFIALHLLEKRYGIKADYLSSARIFIATGLASIAAFLFLYYITAAYWVLLVLGAVIFVAVYLVSAPLVGAVNQADLKNIRSMFSGLGVATRILEIPLWIMNKVLEARFSSHKSTEVVSDN